MTILFLANAGIFAILLFVLFVILLPILALINVLTSKFRGNDQIMWILIIILLPVLGALAYFLIGRDKRLKR